MLRSLGNLSLLAALLVVVAGREAPAAADDSKLQTLITQLDDDAYDLREGATRALVRIGPEAVAALKKAAAEGNEEVTWRAVYALGEIAIAEDLDKRNLAEEALGEIRSSTKMSAARRAEDILRDLPATRQTRAIAMVGALGGKIDEAGVTVKLDNTWEGGDSGLRYLRLIADLRYVQIEPNANISKPAVQRLRDSLPKNVSVVEFGSAFLGVGSASNNPGNGMLVVTVAPDSPAGKGGIAEGDLITKIDATSIKNFDDLVGYVRTKNAGDEVTIEYVRTDAETGASKSMTSKVKLGTRPGVAAAAGDPPAPSK